MSASAMPSKVRILPELLINKIAAGEVVERPASVVKELIENSIDAGADQILVTIKNGGKDLISILDNGSGMTEEDARLSVERHATSKIYDESDLERIHTMGFRGEALASIASISQFELITCADEQQSATRLLIKGGYLETLGKTGFPKGTKITVQNLFFNTPARLKFMKTTNTEFQHIQQILVHQALAQPRIQFRLIHNQQVILNLAKDQTLEERIYQLFGEAFQDGLLEVSHQETYLQYHGLISFPSHVKTSRRWQYLFVNDRHVKCATVQYGVYDAYRTFLAKNQHPAFFLKLALDPTEIDVNVHPAKTEIRFRNTQLVHTLLADHLSQNLKAGAKRRFFGRSQESQVPETPEGQLEMDIEEETPFHLRGQTVPSWEPQNKPTRKSAPSFMPRFVKETPPPAKFFEERIRPAAAVENAMKAPKTKKEPDTEKGPDTEKEPGTESEPPDSLSRRLALTDTGAAPSRFLLLGQLHLKYLVAETPEGLVLIDQHSAHERILFERYRNTFYDNHISRHVFQVPQLMETNHQNAILLEQHLAQFEKLGFRIEPFGGNTYTLREIPEILPLSKAQPAILAVLNQLGLFGKRGRPDEIFSDALEIISCQAALEHGTELTPRQMRTLLGQLGQVDTQLFRPHQRPLLIEISHNEFKTRFQIP